MPSVSFYSNHVAFQICSFPNGADFCGRVNLMPDQHIYRRADPSWTPQRQGRPRRGNRPPLPPQPQATISKFRVRRYLHNNRDYWSPYDLLGLFLSLMGSAPAGATKRNFYLPMTAGYGRWCRQIAGSLPHNGMAGWVRWKGTRKQLPKSPFSAIFSQHRYMWKAPTRDTTPSFFPSFSLECSVP